MGLRNRGAVVLAGLGNFGDDAVGTILLADRYVVTTAQLGDNGGGINAGLANGGRLSRSVLINNGLALRDDDSGRQCEHEREREEVFHCSMKRSEERRVGKERGIVGRQYGCRGN